MKAISLKRYVCSVLLGTVLLSACKHGVTATDLHGRWNYIKVQNPNQGPPNEVPGDELKDKAPYIEFKGDSLRMVWGGKLLSHGTYTVDGSNIQYKEILSGGSTRVFPFYISSFEDKTMVFETLGEEASKVTVVKE